MSSSARKASVIVVLLALLVIPTVVRLVIYLDQRPTVLPPVVLGLGSVAQATDPLDVSTGQLAVAGREEFKVFDISQPTAPRLLLRGGLSTRRSSDVKLRKGYIYAASVDDQASTLEIASISDPKGRAKITCPNSGLTYWRLKFDIAGDYLYMPVKSRALAVIDISHPLHPKQVATVKLPGIPVAVVVYNGAAFVGMEEGKVVAIDISKPGREHIIGTCGTPKGPGNSTVRDITIGDGILYAACGMRGVSVIDVSRPSRMKTIGKCAPSFKEQLCDYSAARLSLEDDTLCVGVGERGIRVYDISKPGFPRLMSSSDGLGLYFDLAVKDGYVYSGLAHQKQTLYGLAVFRFDR